MQELWHFLANKLTGISEKESMYVKCICSFSGTLRLYIYTRTYIPWVSFREKNIFNFFILVFNRGLSFFVIECILLVIDFMYLSHWFQLFACYFSGVIAISCVLFSFWESKLCNLLNYFSSTRHIIFIRFWYGDLIACG